jgi:hypothetical protein
MIAPGMRDAKFPRGRDSSKVRENPFPMMITIGRPTRRNLP